ncbi:autotransporter assembly complex protein TamA [Pseudofulvimonas gallinarii]|uniref:Translocation and assembly module subunit TamA n=1 Tax=Pseudofulvimonas gallinarii TaxID=634155 RepID=A0A4S3KW95_9GAMM|nr:autotransporter assembly complex family protein [Pseudofulvimonas gallinarii]TCT00092.1 translocation and assembly module TamA [Pseudofulvimonas gallinarii]THD13563.1 hypothetical protein B1808_07420 [Pseudofulvimonas gallinarii]
MNALFRPSRLFLVLLALLPAMPADAAVRVVIEGLKGATLREQAQKSTSLYGYRDRAISPAQARRLHERAPDEIRRALQPHGYYRAEVTGDLVQNGDDWVATYTIRVRISAKVRKIDIAFTGEGADDEALQALASRFPLAVDDRLVHARYESGKAAMLNAIQGRGYLRARGVTTRVDVHVDEDAADITLHWDTGPRYRIGETHFEGAQFPDEFMRRFVQHREGDYYDADTLLKLQRRLIDADYFGFVAVTPRMQRRRTGRGAAAAAGAEGETVTTAVDGDLPADADPRADDPPADAATGTAASRSPGESGAANGEAIVPIVVQVAPAPRNVYTAGVSIGTDSGVGVRGGVKRRWVNSRGHKANAEFELSQRLTAGALNYEIFSTDEHLRSFNIGATHRRESTDSTESETTSVFAMENRLWHGWWRDLGLRALYGDFEVARQRSNSTLVFAEGRLTRRRANDDLFPTRGYSITLEARAGSEAMLSDTDFVQLRGEARYIHPLGDRQRLYFRGIAGSTWVDDFNALPPSLRFFAGGDRTIRGYGYQAVGPETRVCDFDPERPGYCEDFVVGGKHLAVLSAEYERDIARDWSLAGFVDTGNAFNDAGAFKTRTGVGVGVRWRSPVGLVRLDIGHGLDDAKNAVELHIIIGPDL